MRVEQYLINREVPFEELFHAPTADAQHTAHAVHFPGDQVAKAVLLRANHGYKYVLAVIPASKKIDFALASQALGGAEVALATEKEVSKACPDCELGALPPIGSPYGMTTLLDTSLVNQKTIVFEGNNRRTAFRVRTEDFRLAEEPLIARLCGDSPPVQQ